MEIYPRIHLVDMATIGNADALDALGVNLTIVCASGVPAPHNYEHCVLPVSDQGLTPNYLVKLFAEMRVKAFALGKTLALSDRAGGMGEAAFMVACSLAEETDVSFAVAMLDMEDKGLEGIQRITPALVTQGESIWP